MASCPQGRPSAKGERVQCDCVFRPDMNRTLSTRPYAQWLNALNERGGGQPGELHH